MGRGRLILRPTPPTLSAPTLLNMDSQGPSTDTAWSTPPALESAPTTWVPKSHAKHQGLTVMDRSPDSGCSSSLFYPNEHCDQCSNAQKRPPGSGERDMYYLKKMKSCSNLQ